METIRLQEGEIRCLQDHEDRMNATRKHFWPEAAPLRLADYVHPSTDGGRVRCRVLYGLQVDRVEYFAYHPRTVRSLQCVDAGALDYRFKYADRRELDALFARRGEADEVLLFRNGLLTDTSIANVALWNGQEWHTPEQPLLAGTHRARLIRAGILKPCIITREDLFRYERMRLFNAMLDFGEVEVPVSAVRI